MSSFFSLALLYVSLMVSFVHCASQHVRTLSQQCWREHPLSAVIFQSSLDGMLEKVVDIYASISVADQPKHMVGTESAMHYGAWTHPPICTGFLQSLGSKLCVYTNSSFSNGRGISIFTTPRIAEEYAALPAFQDPTVLNDVNVFSGYWKTQNVPEKGIGMVAKKHLKFKDRVTAYTPALIAHLEDELPTMEREKFYRVAVFQLPEATRESYLQLAHIYGDPSVRVQDIVKANTFQLQIGGQNHLAVFPETSRLNHACGPNAQYYLSPELLTHFVHVTRPISPGEEITISYTSPLEPAELRQQHLQEGFHFTCSCARCAAKDASDSKLKQIQDMQNALNDWSATSRATPKLAEKMLQLFRKEGLEGFLDIPYGFAALAYNAVGDSKKAEKYAQQAREIILLKDGPWTRNMELWNELIMDPKKHWSFQRRRR